MHQALPLQPSQAGEGVRNHSDTKVRLAARPGAGMAGMRRRLVDDLERLRGEPGFELETYPSGDAHGGSVNRFSAPVKGLAQLQVPHRNPIISAVNRRKRKIPLSECAIQIDRTEMPRPCDHAGCLEAGEFPAPKSKASLRSYYWFCLEHVRAYNAAWDFFRDMNQDQIERFQRDSVTGHRPTWPLGSGFARAAARDAADPYGLFSEGGGFAPGADAEVRGPLDPRQRRALAVLNLEPSANLQEIKMRYKQLVKRYHPDANGGDKSAEERFKSISEAYTFLLSNRAA